MVIHLPEIREDMSSGPAGSDYDHDGNRNGDGSILDVPEGRARSASSPAVQVPGLQAPITPRIDISRASSSSHHDSRESSPDMAFPSELAFREEGALDLRSSTEELAFLEEVPGQEAKPKSAAPVPHPLAATAPSSRRHSRKDSQGSELVMLGVCGRSSRLSSVGSQCSALSRISGLSRSPSPHRMLVETSFCGPRPIDNDPDTCERKVLEMARLSSDRRESAPAPLGIASVMASPLPVIPSTSSASIVARVEVTVEKNQPPNAIVDDHKQQKEIKNKAVATERRRERAKEQKKRGEIVRIKLKPNDQYDDDDDDEDIEIEEARSQQVSKPVTLEFKSRNLPPARTPSPAMGTPQRKASFCSLFRSSPESPASGARRKKSLTEGRPRSSSSSREKSSGLRGSVLSLFRSSRKSSISPPPPSIKAQPPIPMKKITPAPLTSNLKYYEKSADGIIHIPLHSPPKEPKSKAVTIKVTVSPGNEATPGAAFYSRPPSAASQKSALTRTVLPDGSIIIPLHSPTEKTIDHDAIEISMSPDYEDIREQERELKTTAIRSYEASIVQSIASPILHSKETEVTATIENCEPKRNKITKQHVVFSTKMESGDQVFSTQLSVTKTPSLCSETSVEVPLPLDTEPVRQESDEKHSPMSNRTSGQTTAANTPQSEVTTSRSEVTSPKYRKSLKKQEDSVGSNKKNLKNDSNGTTPTTPLAGTSKIRTSDSGIIEIGASSLIRADSSGSEGGSDIAFSRRDVEDGEKRGLVLGQESFEDELPYVPTTLPLERPLGVPIIPVKDRGDVHVAPVQRPRPPSSASSSSRPKLISKLTTNTNPTAEKLRITLPSKTRSGSKQKTPVPRAEWIDFEEVPERRKQPKRIQILPDNSAGGDATSGSDECVVYVAPEQCRCECHHRPANR